MSSLCASGTSIALPAGATFTFDEMIASPPPTAARIGLPSLGWISAPPCSNSPATPDDRGLAVAGRGVFQAPHDVRHDRLAEFRADVEQRREVLDVAVSGERILDDRDAGDTRDRFAAALPASARTRSSTKTILRMCATSPPALSLQPRQAQARRVPAPAAHLLHFRVELVDQRGDRQVRAGAPRLGEADREVLAHPVDREAEIVFAGVHGLVAVLHLPGLRGALGDRLDHRLDVEAGLLGEVDAFRRGPAPARRCRSG